MSVRHSSETDLAPLARELKEAKDTLRAIQLGEVDALVIDSADGKQVYTLQTADHPYRILVQQMNEGALMLSREGFILHANPCFSGLVRALPQELNAGAVERWIAPPDRGRFDEVLRASFEGHPQRLELNLIPSPSDAAPVPVMMSLSPLSLESVDTVCAVVTDLRERRERESLERAELMTRSLMDHTTSAVVITNRDGRIVRANAAALELAGGPIISEPFAKAFPLTVEPSSAENLELSASKLVESAIGGASFQGIQARMRDGDGGVVELQLSAGPFEPIENGARGAVFTLADVTSLRLSEQRFRALADLIPQIVWTLDPSGELQYCNHVGTDYFGMPVRELAHARDRVVHPDDLAELNDAWKRFMEAEEPFQAEYRFVSHRGESRWFLVRAVPIRGAGGEVTQWFGTSTDVDDQKRIENELRSANADLEHFAYAASHDFQEPLRMVTAFAQLLQKDLGPELPGQAAMALNYVLEGTERLGALLQNLLAYIRASRNPDAAAEEIDCNEVLREVIANLGIPIQQSGARILSTHLPNVRCPRVHMLELLQNLVNNAIKYRSAKAPEIHIRATAGRGEWIFSVEDNGIGIAPQHQQNIFGVFKRLHGNNIPGTGIGLAICRRLAELHGGRIWVESQVNRGSVFYFSLPVRAMERANECAHA